MLPPVPVSHAARGTAAMLVVVAAIALAACGTSGSSGNARPGAVDVVATTTVLGDLVREVGGRDADVHQLLQPNSDPHDYEPRPGDVVAAAHADIVFASGDGLDRWIGQVVEQSGGHPRVVDLGARVPVKRTAGAGESGGNDPHWWHDPRNAEAAVGAIRAALSATNPAAHARYARNAAAYLRKLRTLDAGIRTCVDTIPAAHRKLVTDHDAFGYFAGRYGIEIVGAVIPSLTTQAQPSAGDLATLAATVRREHVTTIFSEQSVNPKLAQAIARETGARSDDSLYGDTLGPAGSDGATYLAMERDNADAIVRGLSGGKRGCAIAGL
jgi:zinc/manganese transport system substrate-binding protein